MTPHRSNRRGTFLLDRVFDGVGRIRRASGTTDRAAFRQVDAMLTALATQGRHDILLEIRDGRLAPMTALTAFRQNTVDRLPIGPLLRPLGTTWDAWVDRMASGTDTSAEHIRALRDARRLFGFGEAPIAELPRMLRAFVTAKWGKARTCQLARSHATAFARDEVGSDSPLYAEIRAVVVPERTRRVRGRPLAREEVHALIRRLEPDAGAMVWALCATGMGPKEYWGEWETRPDRIVVYGTKRPGRQGRALPHWTRVARPTLSLRRFARALRDASGGSITTYDFRRTFSRACEEAGIIETNAEAYMGHGPRTMKHLYRAGELPGQLEADAAKLGAWWDVGAAIWLKVAR